MLSSEETMSSVPGAFQTPRGMRALLLDDSNFDRARIRRMSDKTDLAIKLDEVESIEALDAAVARENYDLILIDYRLPVGDGMEALDHVLKNELNKDAGKIMITGDGARQTAIQAMRSGYHDFLTKEEMNAEDLRSAMINAVTLARRQQFLTRQAVQQREAIQQGLIAALQDSDVQNSVISLVRRNLNLDGFRLSEMMGRFDAAEAEKLLAVLHDEDDFIFH
ncbi:response regulator [Sulfitobacter sp. F26204]|uniref:response regulator n=1 Tax=Sulfitobacter sp. F26204 TaxID=2996014 RepID=UPI00225E524A|nr:response regulator [Sulfitobacter sp. F26204]MCX7558858.1 response regulator [Sulfitobacter sp. F26204]